MKVMDLTLQQILTFAYCSMQYQLRYRHKLAWHITSPRAAMSKVVRETVREFFRLQLTARNRRVAGPSTMTVLGDGVALATQAFPGSSEYFERSRRDMIFALASMDQQYSFPRDRMIGFDIPYDAVFDPKQKERVVVKGHLDAAFFRNVDTPFEQVVCVSIISTHDPHEDLVRYGGMHKGFARYVVRQGLDLEQPIQHKFLPVLRKIRSPALRIIEDAPNMESVVRRDATNFRQTVIQVYRGIAAKFAVPTADPDKCVHCPYAEMCSQSMATRKPTPSEREAVESAAEASPLWNWPLGGKK